MASYTMTNPNRRTRRAYPTVQAWMDAHGTNQEELAKALKISRTHLCNILRKNRTPSGKLALRIAERTNVPVELLLVSEKA